MLSPDPGPCCLLTGLPTTSFQNFVQIISNLLAEDNRDKWEEAQLVREEHTRVRTVDGPVLSGTSLSPRLAWRGAVGSNPRSASTRGRVTSRVTGRKSLNPLNLGFPVAGRQPFASWGSVRGWGSCGLRDADWGDQDVVVVFVCKGWSASRPPRLTCSPGSAWCGDCGSPKTPQLALAWTPGLGAAAPWPLWAQSSRLPGRQPLRGPDPASQGRPGACGARE